MSLVCSLVGHDWGEKRVEEERDEARGQVAVTEREYRECTRCGERRVVSENTEVRPAADNEAVAEGGDDGSNEKEEEEETSTFAPSGGFETEKTEDAAIIDETTGTGAETDEGTDTEDVRGGVRESTGAEVTREASPDASDDYACPDCGFSSSDPSLRPGDICPDCGGYLEEA